MIKRFVIELDDTVKGYNEDVEFLERKYGAEELPPAIWARTVIGYKCSNCFNNPFIDVSETDKLSNYCPNCGAKMTKDESNEE